MSFIMHREDMSLVKLSLFIEYRGKKNLNPNTRPEKNTPRRSEEYIYNPLTQRQRARSRFDILNLHLERRLHGKNRAGGVGLRLLRF